MTEISQTPPPLTNDSSLTETNDRPWSHQGRFGRLAYMAWSFVLTIAVILSGLSISFMYLGMKSKGFDLGFLLISIPYLIYLYLKVVFAIRRFHDLDKSGWWSVATFIPLINIIFILYMLLAKGTDGVNRFGAQRTTPSLEKIIGWMYIFLIPAAISILASIAVPAYQDYVKRAHATQLPQRYTL